MVVLAGVSALISTVVVWLVTGRLVLLARNSGAAPERLLATALGGLVCLGVPFTVTSRLPGLVATVPGAVLFGLGMLSMALGISALARFPRIVFRPTARWAGVLVWLVTIGGAIAALGGSQAVARSSSRVEMVAAMQPWALLLVSCVVVPFAWNGIESAIYYRAMRRRLALGLAEAETTHRFLLWSGGSLSGIVGGLAIMAIRAAGLPILAPLPMAVVGLTALSTAGFLYLAFFTPRVYREWLERRAPARPGSAGA